MTTWRRSFKHSWRIQRNSWVTCDENFGTFANVLILRFAKWLLVSVFSVWMSRRALPNDPLLPAIGVGPPNSERYLWPGAAVSCWSGPVVRAPFRSHGACFEACVWLFWQVRDFFYFLEHLLLDFRCVDLQTCTMYDKAFQHRPKFQLARWS